MIKWTGLAPWEFEFPFPGSRVSTFLRRADFVPEDGAGALGGAKREQLEPF